jgi:hypothetical protein
VDIEGVVGAVERTEARSAAQVLLSLGHQRMNVAFIGVVKGLGQFGEDDFAPVGDFGGDDARGVAPVVFAVFWLGQRASRVWPGWGAGEWLASAPDFAGGGVR